MRMLSLCRFMLAAILLGSYPAWTLAHDPAHFCMDCHGVDGASTEPDLPIIGGLPRQYMINALASYWEGTRPCPDSKFRAGDTGREKTNMCKIAKELSTRDVELIATFYASKPFVPAIQTTDPAKALKGRQLHVMHCQGCHLAGGKAAKHDAGILAGQWMDYLRVIFQDFKEGTRAMPVGMESKFSELAADELEALVHFYGSQR